MQGCWEITSEGLLFMTYLLIKLTICISILQLSFCEISPVGYTIKTKMKMNTKASQSLRGNVILTETWTMIWIWFLTSAVIS